MGLGVQYRILAALARQAGEVLSWEELALQNWGYADTTHLAVVSYIHSLGAKLAEKTGKNGPTIETLEGFRYRLTVL